MNTIPLLLAVIVLLLLYIILFVHGNQKPKNKPSDTRQHEKAPEKPTSIIGKTKTVFPSQGTERKPKEADENRTEKPLTFVPETTPEVSGNNEQETDENEFNPMSDENEIDEEEIEQEDLSLLLEEEIEVSDESLTAKEIRLIQQTVKRNTVSEQEKPELQKTVAKLQGSDFLEKLKTHEALQSQLNAQLMQVLAGKTETMPKHNVKTDQSVDDWTLFL